MEIHTGHHGRTKNTLYANSYRTSWKHEKYTISKFYQEKYPLCKVIDNLMQVRKILYMKIHAEPQGSTKNIVYANSYGTSCKQENTLYANSYGKS